MKDFIHRFKESFIGWATEEIGKDNLEVCLQKMKDNYDNSFDTLGGIDKDDDKDNENLIPHHKEFLYYTAYFAGTNRCVYSISIVNNIIKKGKELYPNSKENSLHDELGVLHCLLKYLKSCPLSSDSIEIPSDKEKKAKKIISHFNKPQLTKIDGMDSLLNVLGEDGFIKAIIENSYFFNPRFVNFQFDEMAQSIVAGESIPARKSTQDNIYLLKGDKRIFVDGDFKCPIMLDKDGNAEVRRVINAATGYTISQGKGSIFQNYYISHVWGRAYDPRYFTSLWNLAIVPAWGNSLMDKMADEESDEVERLAAKLKSTMEAVCWKLYDMDNIDWESIKMKAPQLNDSIQLKSQTFTVRILEGDMCIVRKSITI